MRCGSKKKPICPEPSPLPGKAISKLENQHLMFHLGGRQPNGILHFQVTAPSLLRSLSFYSTQVVSYTALFSTLPFRFRSSGVLHLPHHTICPSLTHTSHLDPSPQCSNLPTPPPLFGSMSQLPFLLGSIICSPFLPPHHLPSFVAISTLLCPT